MLNTRRWKLWPLAGLVAVIGVAGSAIVLATVAPGGPVANVVQTVAAVLTVSGGLVLWLWTRSRMVVPVSGEVLARAGDALAAAVLAQWERAAVERRLRYPQPIPVRWRWSHRAVTGPVEEALGHAGAARFEPLPGLAAVTASTVDNGGFGDIFGVYAGLDSGRMVILGDAGTGKSAAAILTLLSALRHRQGLDEKQRMLVPVPVLLNAHGWDPRQQRVGEWLATQLDTEYPFLRSAAYGKDASARLIAGGLIALFLDGFDEIAAELRPSAIHALDQQAAFRLIVLTRIQELVDAVADGHLHGAAAVELLPVPVPIAADYLIRYQVQPTPPQWQRLAGYLRTVPDSPVTAALDNPLMLTLVRDTFPTAGELDKLVQGCFTSRAEVEGYLLDRVLPIAYRPPAGEQPAPYRVDQARRWLSFLATEMNRRNTRDLAWWHIQQWSPATHRVAVMAVPGTLGAGLPPGVLFGLIHGLASGLLVGAACGLVNGIAFGLASVFSPGRRNVLTSGLAGGTAAALTAGIAFGISTGLSRGAVAGIWVALAVAFGLGLPAGIAASLVTARQNTGPRRLKPLRWRAVASSTSLVFGLAFGLILGLVLGLAFGLTHGPAAGVTAGLVTGLAAALLYSTINGLVQGLGNTASPADPVTSWHRDKQSGLMEGFAYGIATAIAFGIMGAFAGGTRTGLAVGLIAGIVEGLAITIAVSQAWLASIAFQLLGHAGIFSRHGIHFLEDAKERGVLRTVGSVYQFRHARLQDQLATTQPHPVPAGQQ